MEVGQRGTCGGCSGGRSTRPRRLVVWSGGALLLPPLAFILSFSLVCDSGRPALEREDGCG